MTSFRRLLQLVALLWICCLPALGQPAGSNTKRFSKDGVSLSYPARWSLLDSSNQEAQKLFLESGGSEASIMLLVNRERVEAENQERARDLALSYVASTMKQYEDFGAKPKLSHATSNIGSAKAEGIIIRGKLDEPRTDAIYWALIKQRVVVLMFGGSDNDRRKAAPAWHTVRSSIQISGPKAAAKLRRNRRRR